MRRRIVVINETQREIQEHQGKAEQRSGIQMHRLVVFLVAIFVVSIVSVVLLLLHISILVTVLAAAILGGASIAITEKLLAKSSSPPQIGIAA